MASPPALRERTGAQRAPRYDMRMAPASPNAAPPPITRVTLFIPGTPASLEAWNAALQPALRIELGVLHGASVPANVEAEFVPNDGGFGSAFAMGTVPREGVAAIGAAPGALVVRWPVDLREGRQTIVAVVERLRAAGALAVRIEESKLGWEIGAWVDRFSSDDPWSWHRGAVLILGDADSLQSCGMHAFSLPDVRVPLGGEPRALQDLASALNVYQLAEDPLLRSGQTFTPDRETPRRVVERWPDTSYPPGHPCHNPFGVWRLGAPGGAARPVTELVPTFMPSLCALLTAMESKAGRPLTRTEVEAARDRGVCMAMKPRDAQKLERSRGYADLEPELVWEQWAAMKGA